MIILLNGPPQCGKDTIRGIIQKNLPSTCEYKMSYPMKDAFRNTFKFTKEAADRILEPFKDKTFSYSTNDTQTPRQYQIDYFNFLADRYGEDILAKIAIRAIGKIKYDNVIVSDCGMSTEVEALKEISLPIHAIQITRPEHTFTDNREYIDFKKYSIPCMPLDNIYDEDLLAVQVKNILKKWRLIRD